MSDVQVIRDELRHAGRVRGEMLNGAYEAEEAIGELLREAQAHPDITVTEAADLAEVGRSLAYKLMSKSSRSDG